NKSVPFGRAEGQRRSGCVLRIAHADRPTAEERDLYAVVLSGAAAALNQFAVDRLVIGSTPSRQRAPDFWTRSPNARLGAAFPRPRNAWPVVLPVPARPGRGAAGGRTVHPRTASRAARGGVRF